MENARSKHSGRSSLIRDEAATMKEFSGKLRKKQRDRERVQRAREISLKQLVNFYVKSKKIIYMPSRSGINHGKGRY
jgi:hypothetical protein